MHPSLHAAIMLTNDVVRFDPSDASNARLGLHILVCAAACAGAAWRESERNPVLERMASVNGHNGGPDLRDNIVGQIMKVMG